MKVVRYLAAGAAAAALAIGVAAPAAHAATGDISTYAGNGTGGSSGDGGLATAAELFLPFGLAINSNGDVFLADTGNNRIRKIDAATGIITTIAGTGTAGFSGDSGLATAAQIWSPYGVAVDAVGNVYFSDSSNHRIRKIDALTGIITTIAGTGTAGFSGDSGLATAGQLNLPTGVTLDSNGNLYISDRSNFRIRRVDALTGIITTVAGNGTRGYSGDGGLATAAKLGRQYYGTAIDKDGNLIISDTEAHRIRKVDALTGIITTIAGAGTSGFSGDGGLATAAQFSYPYGVTFDPDGNMYVADAFNNRIRRIDAATGIITTFAGDGTGAFSGDGGPATSASIYDAFAVIADDSGNIYIADSDNNRVRRVRAAPPTIDSISPLSGPTTGGTSITLTGTHFVPRSTVTIGGNTCTVTAVTSTSITCTLPPGSAGVADVVVANPDKQSDTEVGGLTYAPTGPSLPPTGNDSTTLVLAALALLGLGSVLVRTGLVGTRARAVDTQ